MKADLRKFEVEISLCEILLFYSRDPNTYLVSN